jgi:HEAT repeat protein
VILRVTLAGEANWLFFAYPDENRLGNNGFLQLLLAGASGAPARFIHPARFLSGVSASPRSTLLTPQKPFSFEIALEDWFDLKAPGVYSITAEYRFLGKISGKKKSESARLVSAPVAFTIAPAAPPQAIFSDDLALLLPALKNARADALPEGSVTRLETLLRHESSEVRAEAALLLSKRKEVGVLPEMIRAFLALGIAPEQADKFREALVRLGRFSPQPLIDGLEQAMAQKLTPQIALLLEAIYPLHDPRVTHLARSLIDHSDLSVRKAAISYVGAQADPQAVEPLMAEYNKESNSELRQEVVIALGRIGDEKALPVFIDALQAKDSRVLSAAAKYAGKMDNYRVTSYLIPLLKNESWPIRQDAYPSIMRATGCKLGFEYDAPLAERNYQADQIALWWEENRANFERPPEPHLLNYMLSAFSLAIGFVIVAHFFGMLRDNKVTDMLQNAWLGKNQVPPRYRRRRK